jgi:hypothetical protein
MKRFAVLGFLAVLLLSAPGCGGPDSLAKEQISQMNNLADAIEKKEPAEKQKAIAEKIKATNEKIEKLSQEEKDKLKKKYEAEGKAAAERLFKALVANPEAMANIGDALKGQKGQ